MNYHNPENLTEWGHADGRRLLTTEEKILPDDAEFYDAEEGEWFASGQRGMARAESVTYRTKKPLPVSPLIAKLDAEIKAKQELREIALAVEAGAEWEYFLEFWCKPLVPFEEAVRRGWQVRLKPKPVTRPWSKPEDVPGPVCWLRIPRDASSECMEAMVIAVSKRAMTVHTLHGQHVQWHDADKIQRMEHSTDRINWKPCEVTEDVK